MLVHTQDQESALLTSRFNAHLTFNVFNTLQGLILAEEGDEALVLLTSYARLLRSMLINGSTETTLEIELQVIADYLEIERLRMDGKFSFDITVPERFKKIEIPKSVLISIVENAIKHGMRELGKEGYIRIDCPEPWESCIRIRNNALLKTNGHPGGFGLDLTNELITRYNQDHGSNITLSINTKKPIADSDRMIHEVVISF